MHSGIMGPLTGLGQILNVTNMMNIIGLLGLVGIKACFIGLSAWTEEA